MILEDFSKIAEDIAGIVVVYQNLKGFLNSCLHVQNSDSDCPNQIIITYCISEESQCGDMMKIYLNGFSNLLIKSVTVMSPQSK